MVKFGHYLLETCVPEWQDKYVRYKFLKKAIKKIVKKNITRPAAEAKHGDESGADEEDAGHAGDLAAASAKAQSDHANLTKSLLTAPRTSLARHASEPSLLPPGPGAQRGLAGISASRSKTVMNLDTAEMLRPVEVDDIRRQGIKQTMMGLNGEFGRSFLFNMNDGKDEETGFISPRQSLVGEKMLGSDARSLLVRAGPVDVVDAQRRIAEKFGIDIESARHLSDLVPKHIFAYAEEVNFFNELQNDISTVNKFYAEQEELYLKQTNLLVAKANAFLRKLRRRGVADVAAERQEADTLKKALKELYRGLELLKNFRILNYTACIKIMKKHDKLSEFKDAALLVLPIVTAAPFHWSPITEALVAKLEDVYIKVFAGGDHSLGMRKLRVLPSVLSYFLTFKLGFLVGLFACLLVVLLFISRTVPNINRNPYFFAPFPVFRAVGLWLLLVVGWGSNVYFYKRYRVNHVFILEASQKTAIKWPEVFEVGFLMLVLWLGALNLYLFSWANGDGSEPLFAFTGYIHMALFLGSLTVLLCPFDIFYRSTRWFLLRCTALFALAPLYHVDFRSFFWGDQLCSMVRPLLDFTYSVCFYASGDYVSNDATYCRDVLIKAAWVVPLLPYWLRLLQCVRRFRDLHERSHLVNAGKYLATMVTTTFSNLALNVNRAQYEPAWILFAVISTVYSTAWDLRRDWGFFESGCGDGMLRRKLVLRESTWVYYVAIVFNLLLRISWIFTVSPDALGLTFNQEILLLLVGALEVYRRVQWNFFRMENEHLNNCGKFRAVNLVPLVVEDGIASDDEESPSRLGAAAGDGSKAGTPKHRKAAAADDDDDDDDDDGGTGKKGGRGGKHGSDSDDDDYDDDSPKEKKKQKQKKKEKQKEQKKKNAEHEDDAKGDDKHSPSSAERGSAAGAIVSAARVALRFADDGEEKDAPPRPASAPGIELARPAAIPSVAAAAPQEEEKHADDAGTTAPSASCSPSRMRRRPRVVSESVQSAGSGGASHLGELRIRVQAATPPLPPAAPIPRAPIRLDSDLEHSAHSAAESGSLLPGAPTSSQPGSRVNSRLTTDSEVSTPIEQLSDAHIRDRVAVVKGHIWLDMQATLREYERMDEEARSRMAHTETA